MKRTVIFLAFFACSMAIQAQNNPPAAKLKELSVPSSPAFVLMDISPSMIQTPSTPKTFVLGIAQAFHESNFSFPQNYSSEFAPYWWFNPSGKSIYSLLGIKTRVERDQNDRLLRETLLKKEDYFSGLRFATFTIAFLNKDMIPDTFDNAQKIVSIGARANLFKVHLKSYASNLVDSLDRWHALKLQFIESQKNLYKKIVFETNPERKRALQDSLNALKTPETDGLVNYVNEMITEKPLFSWDIAGAYALYGVGDTAWKTGRYGIWTCVSSFLPLDIGSKNPHKNYLSVNGLFRYVVDHYALDKGKIRINRNMDFGAKIELIFNALSIGVESEYRYLNFTTTCQNRTVGIINYRVTDNLYINGAFGKNFDLPDKLIAIFGINWGFGSEKVQLPQ